MPSSRKGGSEPLSNVLVRCEEWYGFSGTSERATELEAENERLRELLRQIGEAAMSRKTGHIQHLVKHELGVDHFSPGTGAREAEGSGLLSRLARERDEGSNPSPSVFNPPYRYEFSAHGPVTIYDALDVGWIARVKESLPYKEEIADVITSALNAAASNSEAG